MFSYDFIGENSWSGYQNNCLFANLGDGEFLDVARATRSDSLRDGRGVAIADLDQDGRLDVVVNNNNAPPTLYLNRLGRTRQWVGLELVGRGKDKSNRDAVGARVRLTLVPSDLEPGALAEAPKTLTRWVEAGSGYASQSAYPLHFGLGHGTRVEKVEITWPSGETEDLSGARIQVNAWNRVVEPSRQETKIMDKPARPPHGG